MRRFGFFSIFANLIGNHNKYNKMKRTSIIISVIAFAVAAFGLQSCNNTTPSEVTGNQENVSAEKGAIVYFNLDKVLSEYDMANELRSAVESKVQSIDQEVTRRGNKLQNDINSFQDKINKGLITRSVAEVQGQKLEEQRMEFQNYTAQKEQEIAEEQSVMMNQLADAIGKYINKLNETKQYALVLTTQGEILTAPVVTGDASLDITEEVIAGLNEEYVANKSKGNQ